MLIWLICVAHSYTTGAIVYTALFKRIAEYILALDFFNFLFQFCHCQFLSLNIAFFLLLLSLSNTFCYNLSLLVTCSHFLLLLVTFSHFHSLFVIFCYILSLFVIFCHFCHIFITFVKYFHFCYIFVTL